MKTKCIRGTTQTNGYGNQAHRKSWIKHFGSIPKGLFVLHKCDNRWCINPDHLWLGTQSDNVRDCYAKGRQNHVRGQWAGNYKLTINQVKFIRNSKWSNVDLAFIFKVTPANICRIRKKQTWPNV